MKIWLVAALLPALAISGAAMAQVSGMAAPTPTLGATSPLGAAMGSSVSPTGIPLGSTELTAPGVSPLPADPTGTIAIPNTGTICSTMGTSPSGMYGSTATYDGGGVAIGSTSPGTTGMSMSGTSATSGTSSTSGISATSGLSTTSGMLNTSGLTGMCGSGSGSIASSSTPTSTTPTAPGGGARTGLPLGSVEIGNLGVSSAAAVPMTSVAPYVNTVPSPTMPAIPNVVSPPAVSSTAAITNPCSSPGTPGC
jgi:hypothetical protein